jgi:hypothetical protein
LVRVLPIKRPDGKEHNDVTSFGRHRHTRVAHRRGTSNPVRDPIEALATLNFRGVALTQEEIEMFMRTDPEVWFWNGNVSGGRVH